MSDYFIKWVDAVPTVDKSASTVAMVLFKKVFCHLCENKLFYAHMVGTFGCTARK